MYVDLPILLVKDANSKSSSPVLKFCEDENDDACRPRFRESRDEDARRVRFRQARTNTPGAFVLRKDRFFASTSTNVEFVLVFAVLWGRPKLVIYYLKLVVAQVLLLLLSLIISLQKEPLYFFSLSLSLSFF